MSVSIRQEIGPDYQLTKFCTDCDDQVSFQKLMKLIERIEITCNFLLMSLFMVFDRGEGVGQLPV